MTLSPLGGPRLTLRGEIDIVGARTLTAKLQDLPATPGDQVVVDLSAVTFMDSTALAALIKARRRLARMDVAMLVVTDPAGPLHRLLELSGLGEALQVVTAPPPSGPPKDASTPPGRLREVS